MTEHIDAKGVRRWVARSGVYTTRERDKPYLDSPWYWGECPKDNVNAALLIEQSGTFAIRNANDSENYTLTVRIGNESYFIKIYYANGKYGFKQDKLIFDSLFDLVEFHRDESIQEFNPFIKEKLIFPFSPVHRINLPNFYNEKMVPVRVRRKLVFCRSREDPAAGFDGERKAMVEFFRHLFEGLSSELYRFELRRDELREWIFQVDREIDQHTRNIRGHTAVLTMVQTAFDRLLNCPTMKNRPDLQIRAKNAAKSQLYRIEYLTRAVEKFKDDLHKLEKIKKALIDEKNKVCQRTNISAEYFNETILENHGPTGKKKTMLTHRKICGYEWDLMKILFDDDGNPRKIPDAVKEEDCEVEVEDYGMNVVDCDEDTDSDGTGSQKLRQDNAQRRVQDVIRRLNTPVLDLSHLELKKKGQNVPVAHAQREERIPQAQEVEKDEKTQFEIDFEVVEELIHEVVDYEEGEEKQRFKGLLIKVIDEMQKRVNEGNKEFRTAFKRRKHDDDEDEHDDEEHVSEDGHADEGDDEHDGEDKHEDEGDDEDPRRFLETRSPVSDEAPVDSNEELVIPDRSSFEFDDEEDASYLEERRVKNKKVEEDEFDSESLLSKSDNSDGKISV